MIDLRRAVPAVDRDGQYSEALAALRGRDVSGVYAILGARGAVLYVGESHTGRLYDTITRHFRDWRVGPNDRQGRREGGVQYDCDQVKVAFTTCAASRAQDLQYREIERLQPADNTLDGSSLEPVPNPPARKASRSRTRGRRTRGSARGLRVAPGQSRRTISAPNPGPGPLKRGVKARALEITYQVGGRRYRHKFAPGSKGQIRIPASAIKNGWIDD